MAVLGVVLAPRFYYGNDDLLQFQAASDDGLSWSYLSLNVWQHFGPYNRLAHLLVYEFGDLSPAWGLTFSLLHLTALLAACLWLMTELRLSTTRRAVALVVIGLSAPVAEGAVWFDTSMHILPAIAITLAVCAAHVRGVRTRNRTWHVLALVLFLVGQLVQERPLFALPLLVLIDVLLLWRGLPWQTRIRRLWELRGPLTALAVAAVGIAVALRAFVVQESNSAPSWWVTVRTMLSALSNYVVPSLVNHPRGEPAGPTVELVVLAGLICGGVVLAWVGRHNAGPVLFAAAVFLLYYGFLKFSPILQEHTITMNAERLHNAVYVTVPAIIGFAHLRLTRLPGSGRRERRPAGGHRRPRLQRGMLVAGSLALAVYLLLSNLVYMDRKGADSTEARAYLDAVRASSSTWADPDVTLLPLRAHPAMATSWSRPLARHDVLLPLIRKEFVPDDLGGRPMIIDDQGHVRRAALATVRRDPPILGGACGSSLRRFVDKADIAFSPVRGEPLFLRLAYRADQDLEVIVASGSGRRWTLNSGTTRLAGGAHTRMIPLDATRLQAVDLQVLTSGAGLCLEETSIVRAVLVEDGGQRCRAVDEYGRPGGVVDCP